MKVSHDAFLETLSFDFNTIVAGLDGFEWEHAVARRLDRAGGAGGRTDELNRRAGHEVALWIFNSSAHDGSSLLRERRQDKHPDE